MQPAEQNHNTLKYKEREKFATHRKISTSVTISHDIISEYCIYLKLQ